MVFILNDSGTGYIVSDYTGTNTTINIPDTYKGLPVVAIGNSAFYNCGSLESVNGELDRLASAGLLTADQRRIVSAPQIAAFFASPMGVRLRGGTPYLREFKFSILDDGRNFKAELAGERVLLQGVVDCALLEEDGITVVDFKTDKVTKETVKTVAARYSEQVRTYAEALNRIYGKRVKAACLYFFKIGELVEVCLT